MLSPTTGYAISALGCLACHDEKFVLTREIAECSGIPRQYLAKILLTLTRKGFLVSLRGSKGGVKLAQDPSKTSLHEICVAMDDPITKVRCMLNTADCSDDRACPCHTFWKEHRGAALEFLEKTTLQEIGDFSDHACNPQNHPIDQE
jgi:Rrf2 family protein